MTDLNFNLNQFARCRRDKLKLILRDFQPHCSENNLVGLLAAWSVTRRRSWAGSERWENNFLARGVVRDPPPVTDRLGASDGQAACLC